MAITKEQWHNFCFQLRQAIDKYQWKITLHGKHIQKVTNFDEIYTIKQGESPTVYRFHTAIKETTNLTTLYDEVLIEQLTFGELQQAYEIFLNKKRNGHYVRD